jgi:dTDP-glucose pyrophosphorylase
MAGNLKQSHWTKSIMSAGGTIQDIIYNLDAVGLQIVLVTGRDNVLVGTISDGDIRRGLLKGLTLDSSADSIIHRKPLVVPKTVDRDLVLQLMAANGVRQIPIVDRENRLVGLHLWDQIATSVPERNNQVVIFAGGKGSRLRPATDNCPKPMLKVGGKPMLERVIERAKSEGFFNFTLVIHYLGHMIEDYFGSGEDLGVRIEYLREDSPLGTAGGLSLFDPKPEKPIIVSNADIFTGMRYAELLDFHNRHDTVATMAVRQHEWAHPFGVVRMRGIEIVGFEEKPVSKTYINAGVYALSPKALNFLEKGKACDMPSLFERLQLSHLRTVAYPMYEPWLDVGRPDDLTKANRTLDEEN